MAALTVATTDAPKAGRPTERTPKVEDAIISGLMDGLSLVKVCAQVGMPHRVTIARWMDADADFASRCARAREMQADLMDDRIIDLIDETTPENASAQRVKLAAMQWRASKLQPKKYGDKVQTKASGPDGGPVPITIVERIIVKPGDIPSQLLPEAGANTK